MTMAGCLQPQSRFETIIYVPDCYACHRLSIQSMIASAASLHQNLIS
jgi:hypothetical protein